MFMLHVGSYGHDLSRRGQPHLEILATKELKNPRLSLESVVVDYSSIVLVRGKGALSLLMYLLFSLSPSLLYARPFGISPGYLSIPPGEHAEVEVSFSPTKMGKHAGELVIMFEHGELNGSTSPATGAFPMWLSHTWLSSFQLVEQHSLGRGS